MKAILIALLFVCLYSTAQEISQNRSDTTGIRWQNAISWNDIIKKAKNENKYIFVDCYTTWCGPCKRMDEEVYVKDSVGSFMNDKFINVRVQMDRTKKDAQDIQRWYHQAEKMRNQYKVTAFPSYLFLNPDGQIVHREAAYLSVDEFLEVASKAFNPKSQYYTLKNEYQSGKKKYPLVKYLIDKGLLFGDRDFAQQVERDYFQYLTKQPKSVIYTKDNIEFIASVIPDTKSEWFSMFYKDGEKINKLMDQTGFARRAIDSAIAREYINPVFNKLQKGETPDWDNMYKEIEKRFGRDTASRNITWRKVKWYRKNSEKENYHKNFVDLVEMDGLDTSYYYSDIEINYFVYVEILESIFSADLKVDPQLINIAIDMMTGVMRRADKIINVNDGDYDKDAAFTRYWKTSKMDTYACLLFRAGRRTEAINWEKEALMIAMSMGDKGKCAAYKANIDVMMKEGY